MKLIAINALFVLSACAGEIAVLGNGQRLQIESHENNGSMIRLFQQGGTIEVPADTILRFEQQEPMRIPQPPSINAFALPEPKAPKIIDPHALIQAAAAKHRVPAAFVKSIVAAESNFDCNAISSAGAIGLMQLMPATALELGADATIPEENIDAGTRYLRWLIDRYHKYRDGLKRAIAAYNAGPGVVDRYRGVPPYPETRAYVARVLSFLQQYRKQSM